MKTPVLQGIISRRILLNFRLDPGVIQKILPAPFHPKLYKGNAIGGICLIRLNQLRPAGFPAFAGMQSESAAHRVAVEWKENEIQKEGVFIFRRDTSSFLNTLAGGRIFPGKHFHSTFLVNESAGRYNITVANKEGLKINVQAERSSAIEKNSVFENIENASRFFENGALGYSLNGKILEGIRLHIEDWKVSPLITKTIRSGFFENELLFPKGAVNFDHALLMTGIYHRWTGAGPPVLS